MKRRLRLVATGLLVCAQAMGGPHTTIKRAKKLAQSGKAREAAAVYDELLAGNGLSEPQRIMCCKALGFICVEKLRDPARARQAVERGMACDLSKAWAWDLEGFLLLPARILILEKKYEEAVAATKHALEQGIEKHTGRLAAQRLIGDSLLRQGKAEEAVPILKQALADFPEAGRDGLKQAQSVLSQACRRAGLDADAVAAGLEAVALETRGTYIMDRFREQCMPLLKKEENGELASVAVERLREILPDTVGSPGLSELIQETIVRILIERGLFEEAALEGKLLFEVCSSETMSEAVSELAGTLKRADGNMARANQLLQYARTGIPGLDGVVGTADDIPDPLADVRRAPHPERDASFQEALARVKGGWQGSLAKAMLYRYWEKPKLALAEFHRALRECPMQAEPIQTTVDGTVRVLTQISGNPAVGQQFADFQQFGPRGPDRKEGTADDLTNPVLDYLPE